MNTPFLEDGSIDILGIRRSADTVIAAGVAGMLVLAVAAETGSLSLGEKRLVATRFLQRAAGPSLLMLQDLDLGGPGLALADSKLLHRKVPAFRSLKIEVKMPA